VFTTTWPRQNGDSRDNFYRNQGGFDPKVHVEAKGFSKALAPIIIEVQCHESPVFEELMKQGKAADKPRFKPKHLAANKANSNYYLRHWLSSKRIRTVALKDDRVILLWALIALQLCSKMRHKLPAISSVFVVDSD
jgi:hypothetical protein